MTATLGIQLNSTFTIGPCIREILRRGSVKPLQISPTVALSNVNKLLSKG